MHSHSTFKETANSTIHSLILVFFRVYAKIYARNETFLIHAEVPRDLKLAEIQQQQQQQQKKQKGQKENLYLGMVELARIKRFINEAKTFMLCCYNTK